MVTCQNCGTELEDGAKFCKNCGSQIIEKQDENKEDAEFKICDNCGFKVDEDIKFCPKCGSKVTEKQDADSTAQEFKFCANCGFKMDKNNKFCPNCGSSPDNPQPTMPIQSDKSSGLAAVLSFLIIGLGQIYLGLTKRGLILFVLAVISGFLMLIYIGWIIWLFVWIYAIYDAYNSGEKIKNGEYVEDTLNMDNLF